MILEAALLLVKPTEIAAFEADFIQASNVISQSKGYIEHELQRCIEVENKYLLMIKWQTLEDHTVGFRNSELFEQWKALVHPYFETKPTVEHFEINYKHQTK
mgnify:FL=1